MNFDRDIAARIHSGSYYPTSQANPHIGFLSALKFGITIFVVLQNQVFQ